MVTTKVLVLGISIQIGHRGLQTLPNQQILMCQWQCGFKVTSREIQEGTQENGLVSMSKLSCEEVLFFSIYFQYQYLLHIHSV